MHTNRLFANPSPNSNYTQLGLKLVLGGMILILSACSTRLQDGPPQGNVDVSAIPNPTPHYLAKSKYGNPRQYRVLGVTYHVLPSARGYDKRGIASWYGTKFHGQLTSTREPYNLYAMTAANKVLPLPCYAEVTNLENQRHIIVKINDRGPFAPHRIIDLSYAGAKKLGMLRTGTAYVEVKAITEFNHNPTHTVITRHRQASLPPQHPPTLAHKKSTKQATTPQRHQVAAFINLKYARALYQKLQSQGKHPSMTKSQNLVKRGERKTKKSYWVILAEK